ncbi:MAG: RecQ family ATP-dependent DNA helicase [Motilibacteraceae bacterium]
MAEATDDAGVLARAAELARERFGWERLRPAQEAAILAAVRGRDVLAVMPTGSGKSAVYQLAGLLRREAGAGPTLVVSPLLSLQRDQVATMDGAGIRSARLSSQESERERSAVLEALHDGRLDVLLLAPEQLAAAGVLDQLSAARPGLVCVDEAHCISSWGHDFRPDYLRIPEALGPLGHPPVVALTATASPPVRDDVVARLGLVDPAVVLRDLDRPAIRLEVVRAEQGDAQRETVVLRAAAEAKPEIVYCSTRRATEEVAEALAALGFSAAAYHAGLRGNEREGVQRAFLEGHLDVVVATSAFGMGIDKPDVRTVLHAAVPASPDEYWQEVGRAGRDGEPALGLLVYRPGDLGLQRFLSAGLPHREDLAEVVRVLRQHGPLARTALGRRADLPIRRVGVLANLLVESGAARPDARGRLTWCGPEDPRDAVDAALELAEQQRAVERSRTDMMRGYAETTACRRGYLLAYFGEELPGPCGNCDICLAAEAAGEEPSTVAGGTEELPAASRVHHPEWGDGTVMGAEDGDKVTVLFDEAGYKVLSIPLVEERGLLEPTGQPAVGAPPEEAETTTDGRREAG